MSDAFNVFTFYTPLVHGARRAEVIDLEEDIRPITPTSDILVEHEDLNDSKKFQKGAKIKNMKHMSTDDATECVSMEVIELSDSEELNNESRNDDEVVCVGEVKATENSKKSRIQSDKELDGRLTCTTIYHSKLKNNSSITPQQAMVLAERELLISRGDIPMSLYKVLRSEPSLIDMLSIHTMNLCKRQARSFDMLQVPPGDNYCSLRVCSYNVLCQFTTLGTQYLYEHLRFDPLPLSWPYRWGLLSKELPSINADLFGMQEVEVGYLESHYFKLMSADYDCRFKQRLNPLQNQDGCLMAVRRNRMLIEEYEGIEYFMGINSHMNKPQIGQIAVVYDVLTNQRFIFANTHLLFNEKRGDIKLGQLTVLFAHIHKMQNGRNLPVFMTGDFNMQPFCPIYNFVTQSRLSLKGVARNSLSGQGMEGGPLVNYAIIPPEIKIGRNSMYGVPDNGLPRHLWTHPFCLASVHSHLNTDGKKEISTFHRGVANPDFIFYSVNDKTVVKNRVKVRESQTVKLISRLSLPDEDFLRSTLREWPNMGVPSDHIPLVADFAILKRE